MLIDYGCMSNEVTLAEFKQRVLSQTICFTNIAQSLILVLFIFETPGLYIRNYVYITGASTYDLLCQVF